LKFEFQRPATAKYRVFWTVLKSFQQLRAILMFTIHSYLLLNLCHPIPVRFNILLPQF